MLSPNRSSVSCPFCKSEKTSIAFFLKDHSVSKETFSLCDCKDCGLRFTNPLPDTSSIGKYYQSEDYISHSNTKKGIVNTLYHAGRDFMIQQKINWIKSFTTDKKLLDIGCGTGHFMNALKQKGFEVKGVEMDEGARNFAKNEFGLSVSTPDEFLSESSSDKYGIITLWHVLEHIHQPVDFFRKINELLTHDGILMIAVPNFTSADASYYADYWAAYDVPRHLWHFSPTFLEKWVNSQGFRLITKKSLMLDPFYVSLLSEKYKHQGKGSFLSGIFLGIYSTMVSWLNPSKASSLVYVMEKM
jgi:2-polyprenyl-3-methyl-5-hydroxy-6-metoxy-1,4-benzoquinol methylase